MTIKILVLLLEGEVTVSPDSGDPLNFGAGELVKLPAGIDYR